MTTHEVTHVNSQLPPASSGPGFFGRLLQRTRSKRERKPAEVQQVFVSGTSTQVPEPSFCAPAQAALTAPPPAQLAAPKPSDSTMGFPALHGQQPVPMLKKRPSIRDKFRALGKDTASPPPPTPEPERKRTVYVPKHAAADFSRLALSPRPVSRQQQRFSFSYDDSSDSFERASKQPAFVAVQRSEGEAQTPLIARHYSQRGLETLDENEPVQVQRQGTKATPAIDAAPQPVSDPADAHQQRQGEAEVADFAAPLSAQTASTPSHAPEAPAHAPQAEARDGEERQPPSDYELFLARAEERERSYREHLLRTLSQRQYPRPDLDAANLYQPRNSATYTADSAVVADPSNHHHLARRVWEGRLSGGLDSGIGSKSSSQQTKPQSAAEEPTSAAAATGTRGGSSNAAGWERGHRKHNSWTPSFGAGGGRDAERRLERGGADVLPEEGEPYQYTTYGGGAGAAATSGYAARQPRTLRRQTSIKQKLGEYIKPSKPSVTRYEESELTRRTSLRHR